MKKLPIMLALMTAFHLVVCPVGEAANWVLAGTSEDGNVSLYIDRESIDSTSPNVTRAWTKFLFGNPEYFDSKSFSQMMVHMEYDCKEKKARMLELVFNYGDGSRETFSIEKEWRPVKPGTLEDESYRYLCN